jgi:hypothetical protein
LNELESAPIEPMAPGEEQIMTHRCWWVLATCLAAGISCAQGGYIVNYTIDAGGNNSEPLNGLAAQATFDLTGTQLTILLENTSAGVPASFSVTDSLLVSLGMNLPDGVSIFSGSTALIGLGSHGLGSWSAHTAGDRVGEEWIWTNDFGGDLMTPYAQVISTSSGQGGGTSTRFDGGHGSVNGPYGGIAADPPILPVPGNKPAVSDSIVFTVTLTSALSDAELAAVADTSVVEFGSNARYLTPNTMPEPVSLLLVLAGVLLRRRR